MHCVQNTCRASPMKAGDSGPEAGTSHSSQRPDQLGTWTGVPDWRPGGVGPSLLLLGTMSLEHSALVYRAHSRRTCAYLREKPAAETTSLPTHGVDICVQELLRANLGSPESGGTRGHYFPALRMASNADTAQDSTQNQGSCSNLPSWGRPPKGRGVQNSEVCAVPLT